MPREMRLDSQVWRWVRGSWVFLTTPGAGGNALLKNTNTNMGLLLVFFNNNNGITSSRFLHHFFQCHFRPSPRLAFVGSLHKGVNLQRLFFIHGSLFR